MSDFITHARTNYFRVRDLDAFRAALDAYGINHGDWGSHASVILDAASTNRPEGAIALFANGDHGAWPDMDEESVLDRLADMEAADEDDTLIDPKLPDPCHDSFVLLVGEHLVEDDVAVFVGISYEKMVFVGGRSVAIDSAGRIVEVDLEDIYPRADAELHGQATAAIM